MEYLDCFICRSAPVAITVIRNLDVSIHNSTRFSHLVDQSVYSRRNEEVTEILPICGGVTVTLARTHFPLSGPKAKRFE